MLVIVYLFSTWQNISTVWSKPPHLQITCNHLVCDRQNEKFTTRQLWRKQAEATGQTNSETIEFDKNGLFV
jgi:hypothetical protein